MYPPEPIIGNWNASSARLPNTSARGERRQRDVDLLEGMSDDAKAQHRPNIEQRVLDRVNADRSRYHVIGATAANGTRRIEAKIGTVVSTSTGPTTLPEIHRLFCSFVKSKTC
jgi:hypothetical protein